MVVQLTGGDAGFGGNLAHGHGAESASKRYAHGCQYNNFPSRIAI